jgi:hypothetical protein
MKRNHALLIGLGGVAVAGLIVLLLALRSDPAPVAVAPPPPPAEPMARTPASPPRTPAPAVRSGEVEPAPRLADDEYVDEYVDEQGRVVRDRRDGVFAGDAGSAPARSRPAHGMMPGTMLSMRHTLRPLVRDCAQKVPAAARAQVPKLDATVYIDVADEKMHVTRSELAMRDIDAAAGDAFLACLRAKLDGFELAVPGEAAATEVPLRMPYRFDLLNLDDAN